MYLTELEATLNDLIASGKGILAADESLKTIGKRFDAINVENNEENRRHYRSLLCTTPGLSDYIGGVILFEETLQQQTTEKEMIPEVLSANGIVPGIKVDKGLINIKPQSAEKITQGIDGLGDRLIQYKELGAKFAKWRAVYTISDNFPTSLVIRANAECLARYASICQSLGIIPIVEPEVLLDGDHDIHRCAEVTEAVIREVFAALVRHEVLLEYMVLKPSMVLPGIDYSDRCSSDEIGSATLRVLRRTVPAAVPSINFLSGGQTPEQATENLNSLNSRGNQPWILSFSYGRALQEPCLEKWKGSSAAVAEAQQVLYRRAQLNSLAVNGQYKATLERV